MADQKDLGIALGIGGLALIGLALLSGGGEQGQPWPEGDQYGNLLTEIDTITGQVRLQIGGHITLNNPLVEYSGPGRDVFTYFSIRQYQGMQNGVAIYKPNGTEVTVYGSGVAGVHVGPSPSLMKFRLVSSTQPQPADHSCDLNGSSIGPWMCAYQWPGPPGPDGSSIHSSTPICGAPPVTGPADILVQCFLKAADSGNPADADGFSSPTCYRPSGKPRLALKGLTKRWASKVLFV